MQRKNHFGACPSAAWELLQSAVEQFESAWESGPPPSLDSFLPAEPALRPLVLVELIHVDLERRLKAGESARAEQYLQRYPELAGDRVTVLGLIEAEYTFRCRREPELAPLVEYGERFPAYASDLANLFGKSAAGSGAEAPAGVAASTVDIVAQGDSAPAPPSPLGSELPTVSGYEILGVLGRGGMGVVYRARQLGLNRIVALKMIRGGRADPEHLERFLAEAQAVAKLQHPHIVQIYEVGEQQGQPFFSLELVEGGSLDRKLAGAPQPARQAAALVRTLAHAIHTAHQRGIVHRDLKPANVLLAADGTPKVTDFGLAKQLDADVGQTESGAIVGTPAYMAPEQATGHGRDVGPAADVWALGAILYELFTGRPPFRAPTILETLEQVCTREPVPPARLQPGIPRDLETICLKCLRKEPDQRYASAAALAEDLDRFLDGRPIQARRAGLIERAWKWVKRRPSRAALIGLAALVLALGLSVLWISDRAEQADSAAAEAKKRTDVLGAFDAGLDAQEWTVAHVEGLERMLDELRRLDPDQAAASRARLHQRYHDALLASFAPERKAVLEPADVPPIEAGVQALAARDPALADTVRKRLQDRLTALQPVLDLRPPFEQGAGGQVAAVFPRRPVQVAGRALIVRGKGPDNPLVLTSIPCAGEVAFEAAFTHPAWASASRIGLVLRYPKGLEYTFTLGLPEAQEVAEGGAIPPLHSFAEAYKARGMLLLQIRRGRFVLRSQQIPAATVWAAAAGEGVLRLWARTGSERLSVQVHGRPALEFDDILGLGRKQGVFALDWPLTAPLESLRAWRRSFPAVPSPLERGDDAYARGAHEEARTEYRAQAAIARDSQVRAAARFKEGLCELALHHPADAAAIFQTLVDEAAEGRWHMLALGHLWTIRLEQRQREVAEQLFARLVTTYGLKGVAQQLPEHVSNTLLDRYRSSFSLGVSVLIAPPAGHIRDLENVLKLEEILQTPASRRNLTRFYLFRACWMERKDDQALQLARSLIREGPTQTPQNAGWWFHLREEYCLLLRLRGEGTRALAELDGWLYLRPGTPRVGCLPLLLERARIHAALARWDDAEKDLEELFRRAPAGSMDDRYWPQAALLLGFLRERRNDLAGAQAAWRRGLPAVSPDDARKRRNQAALPQLCQMILTALLDDVPDAEMRAFVGSGFDWLKRAFNPNKVNLVWNLVQAELSPEVLAEVAREMWRLPEGRTLARHIAFQDRPLPELIRQTAVLAAVRNGRRLLQPVNLSANQETLLRQAVTETETAAQQGKLNLKALLKLGFLWKGLPALGKADSATKVLPVPLRQQVAYIFGLRYLYHFRNSEQAVRFFRAAQAGVPAETLVHRLARAELERLKAR